jgi:hypothetical protein
VQRHQFLRRLHKILAPRNYLEVGVDEGVSLALSRVPSIGIDPAFTIRAPLRCDLELVRDTSDAFFARPDPLRHLRSGRNPWRNLRRGRPPFAHYRGGTTLDFVFIDGMHLFEFALRDFMNVERFAHWSSVIVLDDMLPRNVDEAARERHTGAWAGDVYKLIPVLQEHRPDLVIIPVDTKPTGVLVVLGADPSDHVLKDRYETISLEWVVPDPQAVPAEIVERKGAVDPEALLGARFWPDVVKARNRRARPMPGIGRIRAEVATLGVVSLDDVLAP